MKNTLLALLLLFTANSFSQTWVQVPDVNFQNYLTANYPAAAFMTSGSDFFVNADHAAIQSASTLNISNLEISSIEGIHAFSSLTVLLCSNNLLTSLPINLPVNLTILEFDHNSILQIQDLPPNLYSLGCANNQLTSLPLLPANLNLLTCDSNQIASLSGVLPDNLRYLYCSYNPITAVFDLPDSLIVLSWEGCQLSILPELPLNLMGLGFSGISVVQLPELPPSLEYLGFNNTGIISLPQLPDSLESLQIHDNDYLVDVGVLPSALQHLDCSNNQITCFSPFPIGIQNIYIANNPFTCLPNYIPAMNFSLLSYPLCNEINPVTNPNGCQNAMGIHGEVFYDMDNECNNVDADLTYIPMNVTNIFGVVITSSTSLINGEYYFAVGAGNYEISVNTAAISSALQVNCPLNNELTATVANTTPVVDAGDFGLACAGFDLGVQSVVPQGWIFPGQAHNLQILAGDLTAQFQAYCAAGISGDVSITVSGPGTIIYNGSPVVNGNTATYSVADFGAVDANAFSVSVLTDTTANSTDEFCVTVAVNTAASGDLDPANNTYTYCYAVVNSYDPNIKETYPELVPPGYTDEFTYTIHFQNTGNAPAINIRLADVLDENLDLNTLKIVDASSDYAVSVNTASRLMSIRFPNIMLADSASDPEGSIGYVQYRIKPVAGLPNWTVIQNTCSIYFDYNSPIVTNTTQNVFGYLETDEFSDLNIKLYPNPASGIVMIEAEEMINSIELYSLDGNRIGEFKVNSKKVPLNISNYGSGVYLVKITTATGISNKRLVIR